MGNGVIWWVLALILGSVLTVGTGGPGVVFLIFVFAIGMLNKWGHGSKQTERVSRWKAKDRNEKAAHSTLESTGRPMTVHEIRFREAMKTAADRMVHRRMGNQ
jgi:hypothetical protein